MQKIKVYFEKMYDLRYFCLHLVKIDLKNKFRRSKLGLLWTFVSPLCLSGIMGTMFAIVFHFEILEYMPYVLSGMLFWDLVNSSFSAGGFSIIGNDSFIRQCNHPLTLYTLKSALVYVITFLIALLSLAVWVLCSHPAYLLITLMTLPATVVLYFVFSWSATTVAGYICARYRDYPMMVPLILQIIWYVSPIFFQKDMFESSPIFYTWFQINPVTHMLELLRAPMLNGVCPSAQNYIISIAFITVIVIWALWLNNRNEKDIIFYL